MCKKTFIQFRLFDIQAKLLKFKISKCVCFFVFFLNLHERKKGKFILTLQEHQYFEQYSTEFHAKYLRSVSSICFVLLSSISSISSNCQGACKIIIVHNYKNEWRKTTFSNNTLTFGIIYNIYSSK